MLILSDILSEKKNKLFCMKNLFKKIKILFLIKFREYIEEFFFQPISLEIFFLLFIKYKKYSSMK